MPALVGEIAALLSGHLQVDAQAYAERLIEAKVLPDLDQPAGPHEAAVLLLAVLATGNPDEAAAAADRLGRAELAAFYTARQADVGCESWARVPRELLFDAPQSVGAALLLEIGSRANGKGVGSLSSICVNRNRAVVLIDGVATTPDGNVVSRVVLGETQGPAFDGIQHIVQIGGAVVDELAAALGPAEQASDHEPLPTVH